MLDYGWRIVLGIGSRSCILGPEYIRRILPESPEFEKAKVEVQLKKAPFFSLFKPPALWSFLQVFFFYDRAISHGLCSLRLFTENLDRKREVLIRRPMR